MPHRIRLFHVPQLPVPPFPAADRGRFCSLRSDCTPVRPLRGQTLFANSGFRKKKKTPVHSMRASEIEQWEKAGGCKKVKRNNATTGGEADRPSLEGAERQLDK